MKRYLSSLYPRSANLVLLSILAFPAASSAENYKFELIFAEVPGSAEIRSGHINAAIEVLGYRAQDADKHYVTDELATLCALYLVKGQLSAASVTCSSAVETDRSRAAYNNRGVFHVQLGDISRALEDFAHARSLPDTRQNHIEELMSGTPKLIASNNHVVAERAAAGIDSNRQETIVSHAGGASIEDLGNR